MLPGQVIELTIAMSPYSNLFLDKFLSLEFYNLKTTKLIFINLGMLNRLYIRDYYQ